VEQELHFLNSVEAARILGVNVSSIKRWTDDGKLECIQTVGGHRKFRMEHLANFVKKNKKKAAKLNVFSVENGNDLELNYHILKGNFDHLKMFILRHAFKGNRTEIQKVLTGLYLGQYHLYQIYDDLLTPVLHEIGMQWMENKLSIIEEHLASQIMRDAIIRLQGIIRVPAKNIGRAVCINLSSELHDIALKMVQNILEIRGFKTYFSGQKTPLFDIDSLFDRFKPDRLYISSTIVQDKMETQQELNQLYEIAQKRKMKLYVGGSGFDILDHQHPVVVGRMQNLEEVYKR
jgi:excisionase family DNA binding protein